MQPTDGRIPDELRDWVNQCFPDEDVLRSLDEVKPEDCLQLSEFIDLDELDRAVAQEQASRRLLAK
jgi:hypothetical protein